MTSLEGEHPDILLRFTLDDHDEEEEDDDDDDL